MAKIKTNANNAGAVGENSFNTLTIFKKAFTRFFTRIFIAVDDALEIN